ncbi:MAG: thioredoxin family protein [Planctomycetes bacterium]|nr:thioredoxin family protein [Planctomycetota bacterium]
MRSLICGIIVASVMVGCTKSDDMAVEDETLTISESQPELPSETAREEAVDESSAEPSGKLVIGDAAPEFTDLIGVDDKKHSLGDFKDAKAVAVVFTCNKCPVAVAYEDRLVAFEKDYANKGVKLVAINVNNAEADKLPAMKTRAEEKGFQFPYLYDPTQKVARDYGAEVTPHIYLLDGNLKLAYVGPVDDNQDETQVTKAYLREATDAVLAGKAPETTDVKAFGCGIQYE